MRQTNDSVLFELAGQLALLPRGTVDRVVQDVVVPEMVSAIQILVRQQDGDESQDLDESLAGEGPISGTGLRFKRDSVLPKLDSQTRLVGHSTAICSRPITWCRATKHLSTCRCAAFKGQRK
jgi:hypothetical protein